MPNVIATRSIANEPMSAWLPRTNRSPSPMDCQIPSTRPLPADRQLRRHREHRRHHREAARGVDDVGSADPEPGDEQAADARARSTSVSWKRPKFSARALRSRRGLDEVGDDRRAHDVLHRVEAGQRAAQHVEPPERRVLRERDRRRARPGARTSPIWHEQEEHAPVEAVGDRTAEQRHGDERDELDRAEQAGQEGRAASRGRSGRAARRAPPACPRPETSSPAMSSRRSREARSGVRSMTKRLNGRAARARRARPAARCPVSSRADLAARARR